MGWLWEWTSLFDKPVGGRVGQWKGVGVLLGTMEEMMSWLMAHAPLTAQSGWEGLSVAG